MDYLGECSTCPGKECIFGYCQVEHSKNVSYVKLVDSGTSSIIDFLSTCSISYKRGIMVSLIIIVDLPTLII